MGENVQEQKPSLVNEVGAKPRTMNEYFCREQKTYESLNDVIPTKNDRYRKLIHSQRQFSSVCFLQCALVVRPVFAT